MNVSALLPGAAPFWLFGVLVGVVRAAEGIVVILLVVTVARESSVVKRWGRGAKPRSSEAERGRPKARGGDRMKQYLFVARLGVCPGCGESPTSSPINDLDGGGPAVDEAVTQVARPLETFEQDRL